ncbi:MAG: PCRF domain-containing protein, partial [bacterium]
MAGRSATAVDLEAQTTAPGFWDDPNKAKELLGRVNELKAVLGPFTEIDKAVEEADMMVELADAEEAGPQRDHALADAARDLDRAEALFHKLEMQSLLS